MKNVAIIMGGYSSEYKISLTSGNVVFNNIDSSKFAAYRIHIFKEKWVYVDQNDLEFPIDKNDFSVITTYENSKYCKPNPKYFIETCEMAKCKPEETLMVGNDVREDMISATIGMETFLVTDDLINRDNVDISGYKQGSLKDFYEYCLQLPDLTEEQ